MEYAQGRRPGCTESWGIESMVHAAACEQCRMMEHGFARDSVGRDFLFLPLAKNNPWRLWKGTAKRCRIDPQCLVCSCYIQNMLSEGHQHWWHSMMVSVAIWTMYRNFLQKIKEKTTAVFGCFELKYERWIAETESYSTFQTENSSLLPLLTSRIAYLHSHHLFHLVDSHLYLGTWLTWLLLHGAFLSPTRQNFPSSSSKFSQQTVLGGGTSLFFYCFLWIWVTPLQNKLSEDRAKIFIYLCISCIVTKYLIFGNIW